MDGFQRRIFLEVPGLSLTIDHHFLWMESVAGKLEVQQSEKQINISITVAIFYHKIIFLSLLLPIQN